MPQPPYERRQIFRSPHRDDEDARWKATARIAELLINADKPHLAVLCHLASALPQRPWVTTATIFSAIFFASLVSSNAPEQGGHGPAASEPAVISQARASGTASTAPTSTIPAISIPDNTSPNASQP